MRSVNCVWTMMTGGRYNMYMSGSDKYQILGVWKLDTATQEPDRLIDFIRKLDLKIKTINLLR